MPKRHVSWAITIITRHHPLSLTNATWGGFFFYSGQPCCSIFFFNRLHRLVQASQATTTAMSTPDNISIAMSPPTCWGRQEWIPGLGDSRRTASRVLAEFLRDIAIEKETIARFVKPDAAIREILTAEVDHNDDHTPPSPLDDKPAYINAQEMRLLGYNTRVNYNVSPPPLAHKSDVGWSFSFYSGQPP